MDMTVPKESANQKMNLGEACVAEAMNIIAQVGLEGLSLREVARRLRVSHQAPYKHFASRDHLLAEVIRRCFRNFGDALRQSAAGNHTPEEAMRRIGEIYMEFARSRPLEYRLMFSTPWPDEANTPGFIENAQAAFNVLKERLRERYPSRSDYNIDLDAMFVWSAIHGIATVEQSDAMKHLSFDAEKQSAAIVHAMASIERSLG